MHSLSTEKLMIILMKFGHLANEKTKIPKHKNLQEFVTAHEK